jgi:small subunit ribosomal protein S14
MAKKSSIARNLKRKRLIERYATKRQELKDQLKGMAPLVDGEINKDFLHAQHKLTKLPKNSSPIRYRNRCSVTGRPRAFIGKFGLSRLTFRELALAGKIPGVTKSSW